MIMGQPVKVVKFEDLAGQIQAFTAMDEEQYFRFTSDIIDDGTWADLGGAAKAIYPVIVRKTTGFEKDSDKISRAQLMTLSGINNNHTFAKGIKELSEKGLISAQKTNGKMTVYRETSAKNPHRLQKSSDKKPVRFIDTGTAKPVIKNDTGSAKTSDKNYHTTTYLPSLLTYTLRGWIEKSEFEKPKPQNTNGKFQMFVGWLPNDAGQQLLKMRKVDLSLPEHSEVFADFLAYWATQDTERTEAEWNKTLLRDFSTGAKARRAGYSKTVEAPKKKPSVRDVPVHTEGGVLTGW